MRKIIISLVAIATSFVFAGVAVAGEVSAAVPDDPVCTTTVHDFDLGNYYGADTELMTFDPGVEVHNCDHMGVGLTYEIALDMGANESAGVRQMIDGANLLAYRLYRNNGSLDEWTPTSLLSYTVPDAADAALHGNALLSGKQFKMYAKILLADNASPVPPIGNYTDTVLASITFP